MLDHFLQTADSWGSRLSVWEPRRRVFGFGAGRWRPKTELEEGARRRHRVDGDTEDDGGEAAEQKASESIYSPLVVSSVVFGVCFYSASNEFIPLLLGLFGLF